ncbi:DNA sulfur modification protein DndE [Pseudomonas sp. GD03944]|uniref:DNA sulfur modification protein DndE n=1 Tax=Pseudomonas sp. GD03944 TaxID=2975409 RepID=UPI002449F344|nr:DNA sulfur modification protein DndE [Pseudomonas sp. GD03944]MDH1261833.1 DNA sulfur modification protein DndE [Pseudomonas sp. GD03944]
MIDRIRLTAAAKIQLSTLKRKTGIEHYNSICRHALCISLANPSMPPEEEFNFHGGIEIDWRTFTGGNEELYLNLLMLRLRQDGLGIGIEDVKKACFSHLHRGLSYLAGKYDDYIVDSLILA